MMNAHLALRPACLLALLLVRQACADDARIGVLPMTADDLGKLRPAQCEAAVLALAARPGEPPVTLMRIGNGDNAYARFARLPGAAGRQELDERLVRLGRTERKKTGYRRFQLTFVGGLPVEVDPHWSQTYRITLEVKPEGDCAARDGMPCARYAGTLDAAYRFRGYGANVPTVTAPAAPVQLLEWCSDENYKPYGMFALPTWLDWLGGLLLRSR
jgi:hypothetical protein